MKFKICFNCCIIKQKKHYWYGTFTTTSDRLLFPMQLIYKGKTKQSISRLEFPEGFSFSCNPKHFINTGKSINRVNEFYLPYVKNQSQQLGKPNQAVLVITNAVRSQIM